ncbi:MAG: arylamine N-acetyltransferase family protein [Rhodanobacteraceae bacterium]
MENQEAPGVALDAYFARIGWRGGTRADLETAAGLLAAHMRSIPFENLDVLLHRPIRLDLEGVQQKLVRARRGGYCFEHGTLLAAVLEKLGFEIECHTARVVLVSPREQAPRTHMFLVASLPEGRFVLDPGFGGQAPAFPVPLIDAGEAPDATHWLQRDGRWWLLRMRTPEKIFDCWASTLDSDNATDFVLGNHYTSTYPESAFVGCLMLHARTDGGAVGVMNRNVTFRSGDDVRTTQLADRRELRALLADHFGFDLPEAERLRVPAIPEWS